MIEASTQFMVGRLSAESGKCNRFNLDGIFGNDTRVGSPIGRPRRRLATAPPDSVNRESFTVTHPLHPLVGQEFEQVTHRQNWGEELVYFHDLSGRLRAVPRAWTSIAAPDPFVVLAAGRSLFRVIDLLELARLIAVEKQ